MSKLLTTPKAVITIRRAAPDDAVALRDLRLEALAGHPEALAADYHMTKVEPVETWVERMHDNTAGNKGVICVASADDRLIGMAGLARGHWLQTRHSGTIWGMCVGAEWRRHGIAEELLKDCIAWAQAQRLVIVKLGVVATNMPAIRCYARCGFTVYGVEPKALCYEGVFYDELLMAKAI